MAAYISFQPKDYFEQNFYTGTGSTQSITGVGFQPDIVGLKEEVILIITILILLEDY